MLQSLTLIDIGTRVLSHRGGVKPRKIATPWTSRPQGQWWKLGVGWVGRALTVPSWNLS